MLRRAVHGDVHRIEAFLAGYPETSMFLRSNLMQYGLEGGEDPNASAYWIAEESGEITAVFARNNTGYLMMQVPDVSAERFLAFKEALNGLMVGGMTGATAQVNAAIPALGLENERFTMREAEPLYKLDLVDLVMPQVAGFIRPATEEDREFLLEWVWDYDTNALGADKNEVTRERVKSTVGSIIAQDTTRILMVGGQPVAKTAFNARLPDMVQIGGVYTPPSLRSQGYARQVVALHLKEARQQGITSAVLFASGQPACRAYEAIGFRKMGSYSLAMLANPLTLRARS